MPSICLSGRRYVLGFFISKVYFLDLAILVLLRKSTQFQLYNANDFNLKYVDKTRFYNHSDNSLEMFVIIEYR